MGSYGREDDLDEYEDDFIDDQDGGIGASKYDDEEVEEEEEEQQEEVEEEPISEEALKLLKYRQKLKDQMRSKMRQENGGSLSMSVDQGRRPSLNNFGSFFGPSQPVIADRVVQQSKALLETRHLAPKAQTSQNNGKKVNLPSTSGPKTGVSRQPPASQDKTIVQKMKHSRDYSFLLSDDADVPKPQRDSISMKSFAPKPDARPAQVAQSNIPGYSGRKVAKAYEQRKPHGTPQVCSTRSAPVRKFTSDNRTSVSSDSRRQLEVRRQPQPTKQVGSTSGSGSVRPPMARAVPPKKPSSSTDKKMPVEKKAPVASVGHRDRAPPVTKQIVPNGRRLPVEKSRAPGVMRPQERNMSAQHSRDRVLKKENVVASNGQMKPPKQSSLQANLNKDRARLQKPHGQMSVRPQSQSAVVKKDSINRKRPRAEDIDDAVDYRSIIRGMFGYNKDKYVDDDDDSDMEVGFDTIQKEESRSARIARKEDEEELAKIMEEERQEMLRKKAKMRKMSQR